MVLALSALPFAAIGLGFLLSPAALVAQLLLYGGLVGARAIAWLVVGPPDAFGLLLHALELTGFAAGWIALRRLGVGARP